MVIRVAVIADSHFDQTSRFDECVRIHDWIADDIAQRGVDLVLHAGDVFERKSTPDERRAVASWLQKLADRAPVVIVRGNHDAPRDLSLFSKLETKYEVIVEEGAGVHLVDGGAVVACLAWPSKASILALGAQSHAEGELVAAEAMRNVLRGLGQQMDEWGGGRPRILLAHAMVRGSKTSVGQPLVGCDLEVGLEDLALARADFYALGHIHLPQDWEAPESFVYPGSPRRTTFGEVERKGYVIAEFGTEDGTGYGLREWYQVPTPCARMFLATDEWGMESSRYGAGFVHGWDGLPEDPAELVGSEIRLRYQVSSDQREAAKAAAESARADLLNRGAASVKVEEQVLTSVRARAPEIAKASTLRDKIEAYWKARDSVPDDVRRARLLGKVAELEAAS